ncbi:MAG: hypothetical protein ACM3U2_03265, partial [Deltaproteobacteria bacterium]
AKKRWFFRVIMQVSKLAEARGAPQRARRSAVRGATRWRRAARDTAFFPSKTQKFACRIRRNAYYDRMKRVTLILW